MDIKPDRKCPECPKTFKSKYHLHQHLVTHDSNAKVKCEICGKFLKHPAALAKHVTRLHSNREQSSCAICHRVFRYSETLRYHVNTVHNKTERPRWPCGFSHCEKIYQSKISLSRHVRHEHVENPVRFPCTLCEKEFKSKRDLESHISTHTTEKPHNCTTCGRSFSQLEHLKLHKETHVEKSSRKVVKCRACPRTFLSGAAARYHFLVEHENQRNYPCAFCDKKFASAGNMRKHVDSMHPTTKEKIYSCDKCEYRSHSKTNLKVHKQRRHDIRNRHQCYFCGRQFVSFQALVAHCGRVHTLET